MLSKEKTDLIIKKAEAEARRGNLAAMNMLHLYDLKRAGHKAQNLDIPSEGGVRYIPKPKTEEQSYSSTSAGW